MKPEITVLMPTWNRDYFIRNSIASILNQTYKNFELLIIDDGSTDTTRQILKSTFDKRIRCIFLEKHQGLVAALEVGNENAKGRIIVKQDSDDISLPNRLEVIMREMKNSELFYHGMYQTWQEENPEVTVRTYIPALPLTSRILKEQYIVGALSYTAKFIKEVPYRYLHCSEDWMLLLDAYLKKRKIGFVNEGLYEYFLHEDSNSIINENTGHYEEDEKAMRGILKREYGIKNFKYAKRSSG